ncbi:hypothetical protein TRFO_34597 [Tritrichomonas foetus]|uniref:Uncharacterized protein n=1 Tax=Tritrichomonas foetus TaxID=1144522 RepID=A0A1J4JKF2_9EUKA|nr:hypothetical protein TRFO_34597 [Tritrichomonas foetus]|eukprot:OHS99097.1 hypothetical protein TRFO_34597 [Tritrichomonas foetus]
MIACDALFICKSCKYACVTASDAWSNLSTDPKMRKKIVQRMSSSISADITFTPNGNQVWLYQPYFIGFQKELEAHGFEKFPLCSICAKSTTNLTKGQIAFYNNICKYISSKITITDISKLFEEREDEISLKVSINMKLNKLPRSHTLNAISTPFSNRSVLLNSTCPKNELVFQNTHQKNRDNSYFFIFGSLTLCSTFRIGSYRLYGTMNNSRLGTRTPDVVGTDEIQSGFTFFGHMIIYISKFLGVDESNIRLTSFLEVKDEKGKFVPFVGGHKTKTHAFFTNYSINILFTVCNNILSSPVLESIGYKPIYPINLEKQLIDNFPYFYIKKSPWNFTIAMKKLLLNFKDFQLRVLKFRITNFC